MSAQPPVPPCYDRKNKIDCPDRSGNCARSCTKWQQYEKARAAYYTQRRYEQQINDERYSGK